VLSGVFAGRALRAAADVPSMIPFTLRALGCAARLGAGNVIGVMTRQPFSIGFLGLLIERPPAVRGVQTG
jgi:hypothetical protein